MLLDVATGKLLCRALQHDDWVHAVAFSPDGKRLLTACEDGFARLWEVPTGRYARSAFRATNKPVISVRLQPRRPAGADRQAR